MIYIIIGIAFIGFVVAVYFLTKKDDITKETEVKSVQKLKREVVISNNLGEELTNKKELNNGIISNNTNKKETINKSNKLNWTTTKSYDEDVMTLEEKQKELPKDKNGIKVNLESKQIKPIVLLVDDSITIRKYVGDLLIKNGFNVILKNDGLEGINFLKSGINTPDLIISDMEMPNMNGSEFIKELRKEKKFKSTPVLVISAHAEKHIELMELELIQGFMHKPFDNNDFNSQVKYLLS